jgi:hypothetical protein
MKRKTLRLSVLTLAVTSLVLSTGCGKDDNNNNNTADMYTINATMASSQEVPTNSSTGTGTVTGTYNATNNSLQYNVSWSGLTGTATVGHFHGAAAAGSNANPIIFFNLVNNGTSGTATGTITLTDAQEVDFLAGKWYANVHTATNTGGEIRAQIIPVH